VSGAKQAVAGGRVDRCGVEALNRFAKDFGRGGILFLADKIAKRRAFAPFPQHRITVAGEHTGRSLPGERGQLVRAARLSDCVGPRKLQGCRLADWLYHLPHRAGGGFGNGMRG
jgi:hypothetical protein